MQPLKYAALLVLVIFTTCVLSQRYYDDLPPGPYCERSGCCTGRMDSCSAPILGTLCYCDDFCNQTSVEDCCPDFWTHCKGQAPLPPPPTPEPLPPPQIRSCTYQGRVYRYNETIRDNCNLCKCEDVFGRLEFLCEKKLCLVNNYLVDEINNNPDKYGFSAKNYSKFYGRDLKEGSILRTGTILPNYLSRHLYPDSKIYDPSALPREFDAVRTWANYVTSIQDQGWCGSSWAISTAAVASDRFGIVSQGFEKVQLSAQQLLSCYRDQQGCRGGHLDNAWHYLRTIGLVDEECYPYTGFQGKCKIQQYGDLRTAGCRLPSHGLRTSKYVTTPAYLLKNETDIMYEIMTSGPVQATMLVHYDFFIYGGGIYKYSNIMKTHDEHYHSVRIVGWGEEYTYNGIRKYWKVANSWGTDWGEDGYFRIERGTDESHIESFVVAAFPKVEVPYSSVTVTPTY